MRDSAFGSSTCNTTTPSIRYRWGRREGEIHIRDPRIIEIFGRMLWEGEAHVPVPLPRRGGEVCSNPLWPAPRSRPHPNPPASRTWALVRGFEEARDRETHPQPPSWAARRCFCKKSCYGHPVLKWKQKFLHAPLNHSGKQIAVGCLRVVRAKAPRQHRHHLDIDRGSCDVPCAVRCISPI